MPGKYGDKVRIQHMIDAIDKINIYVGHPDKLAFENDTKLQDACIRQLQILGEAARKILKDFQVNHPEIAWTKVIGLRNVVIHDYAGIDSDVIWNIISNDLHPLLIKLQSVEQNFPDEEGL